MRRRTDLERLLLMPRHRTTPADPPVRLGWWGFAMWVGVVVLLRLSAHL